MKRNLVWLVREGAEDMGLPTELYYGEADADPAHPKFMPDSMIFCANKNFSSDFS